jgi:hypothetical protein
MNAFARPEVCRPHHFDIRHSASAPRLCLRGDDGGGWTLTGFGRADCRFTNFDAALDSARRIPGSNDATIEVWQGGEYVCCVPREAWPPPDGEAVGLKAPRSATVHRYANRAAEFLRPVVGFGFWLALMVVALSASLGWRFLRF